MIEFKIVGKIAVTEEYPSKQIAEGKHIVGLKIEKLNLRHQDIACKEHTMQPSSIFVSLIDGKHKHFFFDLKGCCCDAFRHKLKPILKPEETIFY